LSVIDEIVAERQRQVDVEGFDEENDDKYQVHELLRAAGCYILSPIGWLHSPPPAWLWPWDYKWWKPTTPRRDLIKAAALIVAEIERIDRKSSS
jgi:hypothetical protein